MVAGDGGDGGAGLGRGRGRCSGSSSDARMMPSGAARRGDLDGLGGGFACVSEGRGGVAEVLRRRRASVEHEVLRSAAKRIEEGCQGMRTDSRRSMEEVLDSWEAHLAGEQRKTAAGTEELRRAFPAAWGRARLGFLEERKRRASRFIGQGRGAH